MAGLKQSMQQKLLQKLSPQQIQLMKLLQVPTGALEQRIKQELEANPALEIGADQKDNDEEGKGSDDDEQAEVGENEDLELDQYLSDDDEIPEYKTRDNNYRDPEEDRTIPIRVEETFHEYLRTQLSMLKLDDRKERIADQIIGSLSDDGYLRRDLTAIVDDLAFSQNISTDEAELEHILELIQTLEPAGVGARDLQECLLLQLKSKPSTPITRLAIKLLDRHFEAFAKKHYQKLLRSLDIEEDELKSAVDEILKLNPKPGGTSVGSRPNQVIIPDYLIYNEDGELQLELNNRNAPDLRVSNSFKQMMKSYKDGAETNKEQKDAITFIKQKIDSAKWFIEAIRQRQQTLYNTMYTIMKYQYDFFLTGDETTLKPMILKDIAEEIKMDISTVSRVANSKYVQTEFGTYPLKYFFSESLTTDTGEEVSTREVKRILQDMIEAESKSKPLSDQKLMEGLQKKGYNIARRTVAKYREQLHIPVARLRKEL